jgi:hypothetical protein
MHVHSLFLSFPLLLGGRLVGAGHDCDATLVSEALVEYTGNSQLAQRSPSSVDANALNDALALHFPQDARHLTLV